MVEESSNTTPNSGSNDKVGSVLVVGAGISGMQSALDLADSGFKVYLLDKSPSIGGTMAQLDKTFPTNDCSMCILAPKLVGTGRHHNIELITNAEVSNVNGNPGNFRIKVLKHAKSVDADKCTGCGVCTEVCPVRYKIQVQDRPTELEGFEDANEIDSIIQKYSDYPTPLIEILLDVNEKYNYLPKDVLKYLSYKMDIPISHLYRMASFYKELSLIKKGKYHLKVCLGTSCHVRGVRKILDRVNEYIANTPEDLFSIETTNCMGACELGPVMLINDELYGGMTETKVEEILGNLMETEALSSSPEETGEEESESAGEIPKPQTATGEIEPTPQTDINPNPQGGSN